jgi:hypothetical protein
MMIAGEVRSDDNQTLYWGWMKTLGTTDTCVRKRVHWYLND